MKFSFRTRLSIFCSAAWILVVAVLVGIDSREYEWFYLFAFGMVPVFLAWGISWVVTGYIGQNKSSPQDSLQTPSRMAKKIQAYASAIKSRAKVWAPTITFIFGCTIAGAILSEAIGIGSFTHAIGAIAGAFLGSVIMGRFLFQILSYVLGKNRFELIYTLLIPAIVWLSISINGNYFPFFCAFIGYSLGTIFFFKLLSAKQRISPSPKFPLISIAILLITSAPLSIEASHNRAREREAFLCRYIEDKRLDIGANNSQMDEYCVCMAKAVIPNTCKDITLLWSSALTDGCASQYHRIASEVPLQSIFDLQNREGCIKETMPALANRAFERQKEHLVSQGIAETLRDKNFKQLPIRDFKKKQISECMIRSILDYCPNKTIVGYQLCYADDNLLDEDIGTQITEKCLSLLKPKPAVDVDISDLPPPPAPALFAPPTEEELRHTRKALNNTGH